MPAQAVAGEAKAVFQTDFASRFEVGVPVLHIGYLPKRPAVGFDFHAVGGLIVSGAVV